MVPFHLPVQEIRAAVRSWAHRRRVHIQWRTGMTSNFPDPWLADSEWLLNELAKAREQILRIPFRLDNKSDIDAATGRIFELEKTLRFLLHLHREGQRSFVKQSAAALKPGKHSRKSKSNIVRIRA